MSLASTIIPNVAQTPHPIPSHLHSPIPSISPLCQSQLSDPIPSHPTDPFVSPPCTKPTPYLSRRKGHSTYKASPQPPFPSLPFPTPGFSPIPVTVGTTDFNISIVISVLVHPLGTAARALGTAARALGVVKIGSSSIVTRHRRRDWGCGIHVVETEKGVLAMYACMYVPSLCQTSERDGGCCRQVGWLVG